MQTIWRALLGTVVAAAMTAPAAGAENTGVRAAADPTATVPAFSYVSPFADYRHFDDGAPIRWRDANDSMRELRGHAGHLRDGSGPAETPTMPQRR